MRQFTYIICVDLMTQNTRFMYDLLPCVNSKNKSVNLITAFFCIFSLDIRSAYIRSAVLQCLKKGKMCQFIYMFLLCMFQFIDTKMTVINDQNSVKQRYAINFRGSVHDRAIAIRDVVLAERASDVQKPLI